MQAMAWMFGGGCAMAQATLATEQAERATRETAPKGERAPCPTLPRPAQAAFVQRFPIAPFPQWLA